MGIIARTSMMEESSRQLRLGSLVTTRWCELSDERLLHQADDARGVYKT